MEAFAEDLSVMFAAGGYLMWLLAALAFWLYFSAFEILFRVIKLYKVCSKNSAFAEAYADFAQREFEDKSNLHTEGSNIKKKFAHIRLVMLSGVDRRLVFLKIMSSVAPLLGLLGTVVGMSQSIASSSGDYAGVAAGVSKALVTTQAGLVVAIPAWILTLLAGAQTHKLLVALSRRESAMIKSGGEI